MNNVISGIVSVAVAIVGVAMLAVIFSRNANTAQVIRESGNAFAATLAAATAPVSSSRVAIGVPG